jgi:hypothetical protein
MFLDVRLQSRYDLISRRNTHGGSIPFTRSNCLNIDVKGRGSDTRWYRAAQKGWATVSPLPQPKPTVGAIGALVCRSKLHRPGAGSPSAEFGV